MVRWPLAVGAMAATLSMTASASAGTRPRPVTVISVVVPALRWPMPADCPSTVGLPGRVSSRRAGTSDAAGSTAASAWLVGPATAAPTTSAVVTVSRSRRLSLFWMAPLCMPRSVTPPSLPASHWVSGQTGRHVPRGELVSVAPRHRFCDHPNSLERQPPQRAVRCTAAQAFAQLAANSMKTA